MNLLDARIAWARAVLVGELARGRARGYLVGEPIAAEDPPVLGDADDASPMGRLADAFALDATEQALLWLLACCELDPGIARLAHAVATPGMTQLGVHHALHLLGAGARTIDRLAAFGLVEVDRDARLPIPQRRIRIDDRVLELVRGQPGTDPALDGLAALASPPRTACEVPVAFARAATSRDDLLVIAIGPEGSDRELAVRVAAARPLLVVTCGRLATDAELLARQLRACVREARICDAALVFAGADRLVGDPAFARAVALVDGPVFATMASLVEAATSRPTIAHVVVVADLRARTRAWAEAMPGVDPAVIEACAERYRLPTALVGDTARAALAERPDPDLATIHRALRDRLDRRLAGFARRVAWEQTWSDLVLPPDQIELLVDLVARVRHRRRVLDDWGFAAKIGKGFGVSALLSGPPGTGKTMIAGLVAKELGLDLYQVDLSRIVSKYIGETEKQLAALFDAAEHGQAVILFDEADSLFGKRTEVRSSNDRYANLETNYLLQRLEAFEGICILTTNHATAIDEAFLRRLSTHIRVPMPDDEQREKLWHAMLPAKAEVRGRLDFTDLARDFVMSGGYIKNAVVRAAYLAAADEGAIELAHFERAARAEYEAMGKVAYDARRL